VDVAAPLEEDRHGREEDGQNDQQYVHCDKHAPRKLAETLRHAREKAALAARDVPTSILLSCWRVR
jgi:hypothetical protein